MYVSSASCEESVVQRLLQRGISHKVDIRFTGATLTTLPTNPQCEQIHVKEAELFVVRQHHMGNLTKVRLLYLGLTAVELNKSTWCRVGKILFGIWEKWGGYWVLRISSFLFVMTPCRHPFVLLFTFFPSFFKPQEL